MSARYGFESHGVYISDPGTYPGMPHAISTPVGPAMPIPMQYAPRGADFAMIHGGYVRRPPVRPPGRRDYPPASLAQPYGAVPPVPMAPPRTMMGSSMPYPAYIRGAANPVSPHVVQMPPSPTMAVSPGVAHRPSRAVSATSSQPEQAAAPSQISHSKNQPLTAESSSEPVLASSSVKQSAEDSQSPAPDAPAAARKVVIVDSRSKRTEVPADVKKANRPRNRGKEETQPEI